MEIDRLYKLLPEIYRLRDADEGYPLQALLRVIAEQAGVIEEDIAQLYENWFIETCEDWVTPYLGDLVGWTPIHEAGEPGDIKTERDLERNKILIPRRDVAKTIYNRRRKGTLALLELLAADVAGWPARAVEFFKLLGWTQNLNFQHPDRGRLVDLRDGDALDLIDFPFDRTAHTIDVRRINSHQTAGRHNLPSVGLFVCRLKSYSATRTPAHCEEEVGPHCFTFSALGNDAPLFNRVEPESDPDAIAGELNLPGPIRRRAFESRQTYDNAVTTWASEKYYGDGKSLAIWLRKERSGGDREPGQLKLFPAKQIIPADLSDWKYRPRRNYIAVDPHLGRMVFPPGQLPKEGVWVSYHYGFSGEIGGGEYERAIPRSTREMICRVGAGGDFQTINAALEYWKAGADEFPHGVIEITDSGVYVEPIKIDLQSGQSLKLRAANRKRPMIRLLDWSTERADSLSVAGERGSRFMLDGIIVAGRSVMISGDISDVTIRHSTLVPGWSIDVKSKPRRPAEPSLELFCPLARINIEHSIIGSIQVNPLAETVEEQSESQSAAAATGCGGVGRGFRLDPICLEISDSIVDATSPNSEAIGAPGCIVAHARLTAVRSTIIGKTQVHAVDLGENSIFYGAVTVARRQIGCLRFSYVTPGSRTPQRFHCQPDLAEQTALTQEQEQIRLRVRPQFMSRRYGSPNYCRLSDSCAEELRRGADDRSEMGVFHDLYLPQRLANLRARVDEYTPAGMDVGIIFVN